MQIDLTSQKRKKSVFSAGTEPNQPFLRKITAKDKPSTDIASLLRENQSLHLEVILLERRIQGMIEVIQSKPQLEKLYLKQMAHHEEQKKERHLFQIEKMG